MTQGTFLTNWYENSSDIVLDRYLRQIEEHGWSCMAQRTWESDSSNPGDTQVRFALKGDGYSTWLLDNPLGGIAILSVYTDGKVNVTSVAEGMAEAESFLDLLQERMPEREAKDDGTVPVRFWYRGSQGPQSATRQLSAPLWSEINQNYTASVADAMTRLVSPEFVPGRGGQLILWHGQPGTGKTWALRAMAREWAKWCRVDYVVDPEAFFGQAAYLMQMLLHEAPRYTHEDDAAPKNGWRLIVFEDTGELLSADARERAGQGLSRLLNTVDGFIGQGLRTLILVTTNEELDKLHPAVARPGRAAAKIAFGPLTTIETTRWAKAHGILTPRTGKTLAELFALRDGFERDPETRAFGFNAA